MVDGFSQRYGDLLAGSYDCVDRIVLNAYYPLGHSPGGLRVWWRRWHEDSDDDLDNARLMRLAGRFARRVRAWAGANGVPVIDCGRGERKHRIVEQYLATHTVVGPSVFLILVAKAPATVWEVRRGGPDDVIVNIVKKSAYVNHYSFHIMDPVWGHVTINMSGHPPFAAQVILNGHEYVARAAQVAGMAFTKEGNCFTAVAEPRALAQVADTWSQDATVGRLGQVCDRWTHTACLCFGLDLDEQAGSGFRNNYSVFQVEYSRNLIFRVGGQMDRVFNTVVDRTRARLDVPTLRTMFGAKRRPGANGTPDLSPKLAVVIETPRWDLTLFKVHFGLLTLKGYTKGERVLRFEAVAHNTKQLGCGRTLDKFPTIVTRLAGMTERFTTTLDCVDVGFIPDHTLDDLPAPSRIGVTRAGGVDLNKTRTRAALAALLTLRDPILGPILAGIRSPRMGRKPAHWNQIDRHYETLRVGMHTLFDHLGITTAASTTFCLISSPQGARRGSLLPTAIHGDRASHIVWSRFVIWVWSVSPARRSRPPVPVRRGRH